jgi:hypothetical protein
MHRVRLFVLMIMMFAVPFQGYAAAAMVFCGSGPSGTVAAKTTQTHDHAQHPHGDGRDQAEHAVHDSDTGTQPDGMHKCGTCGACHGTALIGTLPLAVFHDLPAADLAQPAIAMATRVPRVLDKPPRA